MVTQGGVSSGLPYRGGSRGGSVAGGGCTVPRPLLGFVAHGVETENRCTPSMSQMGRTLGSGVRVEQQDGRQTPGRGAQRPEWLH